MGQVIMSGIVPKLTVPSAMGVLNDCTWEQIKEISDAGQAANYWAIGDTKAITLNGTVRALTFSNETYYAFIIGIDHNKSIEGKGIHFQFGKSALQDGTDIVFADSNYNTSNAGFCMNGSATNTGGWASSYMRNTICSQFLAALPSELQAVISACTKYTDNTGGRVTIANALTPTEDKIFLLSVFEARGIDTQITPESQRQQQYAYYAAGNSITKYQHNATTAARYWWTRTPSNSQKLNFVIIAVDNTMQSNANFSYGFAPCFKVGGADQ